MQTNRVQVSVLDSVLILLSIDNIASHTHISNEICMFADDTSCTCSKSDITVLSRTMSMDLISSFGAILTSCDLTFLKFKLCHIKVLLQDQFQRSFTCLLPEQSIRLSLSHISDTPFPFRVQVVRCFLASKAVCITEHLKSLSGFL